MLARFTTLHLGIAALAILATTPALAQNKCAGDKIKAAAKKTTCLSSLAARQASTGDATDPLKVTKCESNVTDTGVPGKPTGFAKIESKAKVPCLTVGDAPSIEAKVDAFVDDLVSALDVAVGTNPNACEGAKIKAAAKTVKCLATLESKQAATGGAIDPLKVTKCEGNVTDTGVPGKPTGFAKIEATKAPCNTTGDASPIEASIDAFIADLDGVLNPAPTTTTTSIPGSTTSAPATSSTTSTTIGSTTSTTVNFCNAGGAFVAGVCWYKGFTGNSCFETCAAEGIPYSLATRDYAGSNGTDAHCTEVAQALTPGATSAIANNFGSMIGCFDDGGTTRRDTSSPTSANGNLGGFPRYCACDTNIEYCGEGTIGGIEECDDGNSTSGDGCSASCTIEPGFDCTGEPSVCTPQ